MPVLKIKDSTQTQVKKLLLMTLILSLTIRLVHLDY